MWLCVCQNYFLHAVSTLRASVDLRVAKKTIVPYTNLLKNGVVIQAEVAELQANQVLLHGRAEPLRFDYCVVATGSSYSMPAKVAEPDAARAYARYEELVALLSKPEIKNVVVVGGGSVGVELAAEVAEAHPTKSVTLVHPATELISGEKLKAQFRIGVMEQLAKLGVKVLTQQRVELPAHNGAEGGSRYVLGASIGGQVVTTTGTVLPVDVLFQCAGARTNTKCLTANFGAALDGATGRLRVNAHMQVEGHPSIYAVGDIAGTHTKRAMFASQQGEIAAKNIAALVGGKANPKLHSFALPAGHPLVLTVGRGGMSQFFNAGESVWGSTVTGLIKGQGLFLERTWADLNQKAAYARLEKADSKQPANSASVAPLSFPSGVDVSTAEAQAQIAQLITLLHLTQKESQALIKDGLAPSPLQPSQDFV